MTHMTVTTIRIEATGTWTFDSLKTVGGTDVPVKSNATLVTGVSLPETLAGTTVTRYISGDWNAKLVLKATYAGHQVSFPMRVTRGDHKVVRLSPADLQLSDQQSVDANAGSAGGGGTGLTTGDIDVDATMAANSDVKIASQKATKTALATKPTATLDVDATMVANSDTVVPSQKAVKTALATKPTATLDTDVALTANSDTVVASQKAAKAYSDLKIALTAIDTDSTFAANSDTKLASQKAVKTATGLLVVKTANLSDIATPATARTNLGVAYGTSAGTVLQGNQALAGDVTGVVGTTVAAKINGTAVPATPTIGQMLVALTGTTAQWQAIPWISDPASQGLLAWTQQAGVAQSNTVLTTGTLYVCKVRADVGAASAVRTLHFTQITGATGLTLGTCNVFDSAGTKLGSNSADQSATWNAGAGQRSVTVGSFALTQGSLYYLAILAVGTTGPALGRGDNAGLISLASPAAASLRYGTAGTGLSVSPASITPGSIAASNPALLMGLS